jgi:undecaprenyl pyrophosphate synthase
LVRKTCCTKEEQTMIAKAPPDIALAVREAVRDTIAGTVRAWAEELTATELNADEIRSELRPLLLAVVRQELTRALNPPAKHRKNGKAKR